MILELLVFLIAGMTILTAVSIFLYSLIPPNISIIDWATLILAFATVLLAIATGFLWMETRYMRKRQSQPIIAIITRPLENRPQSILMSITNCWWGLAKEIKIQSTSDFPVTYDGKITIPFHDLGIVNHPFELGKDQSFEFQLKWLPENYEKLRAEDKLRFSLLVHYKDIFGEKYKSNHIVDLEIYHHLVFPISKLG